MQGEDQNANKESRNMQLNTPDLVLHCRNELELMNVVQIMKINGDSLEELSNNIGRIVARSTRASSPFKSPITPKAVNLRKAMPREHIRAKIQESVIVSNQIKASENVFQNDTDPDNKQRRKSSILAADKHKTTVHKNTKEPEEDSLFVKSSFESMFCGISKVRKQEPSSQSRHLITRILETPECAIPSNILHDKTNSPMKTGLASKESPQKSNTTFFVEDPILIDASKPIECDFIELDTPYENSNTKGYLKTKYINTKLNEGYKTVEIRRKSVIDLFNCPKSFFRKSERQKTVYFDMSAKSTKHNSTETPNSIFVETAEEEQCFEWTGDKSIVEVVKRIDFGSEISVDDFIFTPISNNKEIES